MEHITLLVVGLLICFIGITNMRGNIKTVHSYNRRKVKEEDIPKYGKAVGLGTLIIGLFMIAAFIASLFVGGEVTGYVMIPALSSAWGSFFTDSSGIIRGFSDRTGHPESIYFQSFPVARGRAAKK